MSAGEAARLAGAVKSFGATRALDGFDLTVRRGEVHALLGPNGAGKTTALDLLLGLRRPDRGGVRLLGGEPRDAAIRRRIGVTPQEAGFPQTLQVREIVDLVRVHYPAPAVRDDLLARFGLADVAHRQAGGLSGGERRRLAAALAFAGAPEAVFLDEPTTGLDVRARRAVWNEIRAFAASGGTVLLTTHYLDEAEALASRVTVVVGGRAVATGSVADVRGAARLTRLRVRGLRLVPPSLVRAQADGELTTYYVSDADAAVRWLVERRVPLDGLEVLPASLEEAFVALTEARP